MPVTDFLERNVKLYGDETALVELNPEMKETRRMTWTEYDLIQPTTDEPYRREITWNVFNEKANRFANMLLSRGVKKGDKVAILMYNCLEWLPIYFGVLKTGALAVPFNFRYSAEEIQYCADLAEVQVLVFGPEFIGRIETVADKLSKGRLLIYVGDNCPTFAESYRELAADCSSAPPQVLITDDDDGAIYFSSGTTGFPKAILHKHRSLTQAAEMEQKHHRIEHDDVFLCIPPLYHTGAKFHWMGSLIAGSKAVLLKGTAPEIILKAASDEQCTVVWLLVPWAQDILDALDRGEIQLSEGVTPARALQHPNWSMGAKVTIDSATLMNKGLELLEAMSLFDVPPEKIQILIHRESILHSAVEYCDNSVIAQLGDPDMRLPIQYALSWPDRTPGPARPLDLLSVGKLTFAQPDLETFRCLALAIRAAREGGTAPAILNGANEVAVERFLAGKIGFLQIPQVVEAALDTVPRAAALTLERIQAADQAARRAAARAAEG